jgi:fatty-acyl-CoA synthase
VIGVFNLDGVVGSVGRPTSDLSERLAIVRLAPTPDGLVRNPDGRLVRCDPGEAGELIARLSSRDEFEGYSSAEATRSKLLDDAFEPGDVWYRSGDRFRADDDGYLYFVSRLGDTYRWKGENVSTQQVAEAITDCSSVSHAVVYGVEVPGHEGRAGMALVTLREGTELDGAALYAHLERELIAPAIPLFVRLGDGAGRLTETYKLAIADLARDGYSPELVADPLYVLDPTARSYVPLSTDTLTRLGLPAPATAHDTGVNHG